MKKSIHTKQYKEIIKRVRLARLEAELSQAQVAKKLKWSQATVSNIETCERRIDILEMWELAKLYQKSISHFFPDGK